MSGASVAAEIAMCGCGVCGLPAPIAKRTDRHWGHVKGQPMRFVVGHARRRPPDDRFWEKVEKQPGDGCWPWTGARNKDGYGCIWVGGRMVKAQRLSWELTHGPIPPETPWVLHNCPGGDNPSCVNPAHLWLGGPPENVADMMAKGRHRNGGLRGEQNGGHKLTEAQAREIHPLAASGMSQSAIARRFGVSHQNVSAILAGLNWAHLKEVA